MCVEFICNRSLFQAVAKFRRWAWIGLYPKETIKMDRMNCYDSVGTLRDMSNPTVSSHQTTHLLEGERALPDSY